MLGEWPLRWWVVTVLCVTSAVMAAVGAATGPRGRDGPPLPQVRVARSVLPTIHAVSQRVSRSDYERSAFGTPWTDGVSVHGGGNGCDTRNDILTRDLVDIRQAAIASCPHAVMSGEFRSPYTGRFIVFRRDRRASSVQIDHMVPLAYAWDMGAWRWSSTTRTQFANDPANLIAVDGGSNQDKGDKEPARWMPPDRRFHCQYAAQFVTMVRTYGLDIDTPSRDVLGRALTSC